MGSARVPMGLRWGEKGQCFARFAGWNAAIHPHGWAAKQKNGRAEERKTVCGAASQWFGRRLGGGGAPSFGRESGGNRVVGRKGGFPDMGGRRAGAGCRLRDGARLRAEASVGEAGACRPMQGYVYEVSSWIMRFNMLRICALQD